MYYKGNVQEINKTTKYYMKNTSDQILASYSFRYRARMSEPNDNVYEYVFPVYRYHDCISLEGRFLLHKESHIVTVDVFDCGNHGIYAPWYYDSSGIAEKIISTINRNISKEMRKLHISKYRDDIIKDKAGEESL